MGICPPSCYYREMFKPFPAPAAAHQIELEFKKSRFIGLVERITNKTAAKQFLQRVHQQFPDARHICWAYLVGNPQGTCGAAMNDAGEPAGTAGKPILNVIQHKGIGNVMVVVVRYFGGIKLGAGGLVRAYSKAAETVLSEIQLEIECFSATLNIEMEFSNEQFIRHWLEKYKGTILDAKYTNKAMLEISLPEQELSEFVKVCEARNIIIKRKNC